MKLFELLKEMRRDGLRIGEYGRDEKTKKRWLEIIETIDGKEFNLGRVSYKEPIEASDEEQEKAYEQMGEYLRPESQIVRLQGRKFEISFIHDADPMWVDEIDD